MEPTKPNSDRLTTWQPEMRSEQKLWLVDQVTILAEAFGEGLTPARIEIYATDLMDLTREQVQRALWRSRRELKFFPKISELRDLAGLAAKDVANVEAEAAWKFANDYLRKWGVDRMPLRSKGQWIEAPELPERVAYALRRIGGLSGLNQITEESRPFMFRDFCEAYNLFPLASDLAPQLADKFLTPKGEARMLGDGAEPVVHEKPYIVDRAVPKPIPRQEPLTDAELADRREMLRQQAEALKKKNPA